jgi:glyoxylase-like metal-dependent hydrolase (beta-lactamase superfamily II)
MNLEDHLGDIIRKGRAMSGVSLAAAAQTAGVTEADLSALEESGQSKQQLQWEALGRLLQLNGKKLENIAKGWTPSQKNLSTWRELRVITTTAGGITVNCYMVWDEVSREAALFDTGWEPGPILQLLQDNQVQLRHIFITHSHEDHIAGLDTVHGKFPKARLHTSSKIAAVDQRNRSNDFIHLGSLRITHRDTPGHAEDGTTYIVGTWPDDAPHVALVGDAIFSGSIGRGNQSWDIARQKVREQILSLPAETLLCPGHGPLTTVAEEKSNNPFF